MTMSSKARLWMLHLEAGKLGSTSSYSKSWRSCRKWSVNFSIHLTIERCIHFFLLEIDEVDRTGASPFRHRNAPHEPWTSKCTNFLFSLFPQTTSIVDRHSAHFYRGPTDNNVEPTNLMPCLVMDTLLACRIEIFTWRRLSSGILKKHELNAKKSLQAVKDDYESSVKPFHRPCLKPF